LRAVRSRRMAVDMPGVCGGYRGLAVRGGARAAAIKF